METVKFSPFEKTISSKQDQLFYINQPLFDKMYEELKNNNSDTFDLNFTNELIIKIKEKVDTNNLPVVKQKETIARTLHYYLFTIKGKVAVNKENIDSLDDFEKELLKITKNFYKI